MKEQTVYKIYKLNSTSPFCCNIEANSEKDALKKYQKGLTSSGQSWIEKYYDMPALFTSYGAAFVATKMTCEEFK